MKAGMVALGVGQVPESLKDRINQYAAKHGIPMSAAVKILLDSALIMAESADRKTATFVKGNQL